MTAECPGGRHGVLRCVAFCGWHGRDSDARRVRHARHAGFVHEPAKWHMGRSRGGPALRRRTVVDIHPGRTEIPAAVRASRARALLARDVSDRRGRRQLPDYLQFALGGANSVRGWSLGSRRGPNQFIGTFEYTYVVQPVRAFSVKGLNLYGGLQLVGFADVGRAWGDGDERSGVGVGHRWLRRRTATPRAVCRRHPARRGVGRARTRRDRVFRRVAQGRAPTPTGSMTTSGQVLRGLYVRP